MRSMDGRAFAANLLLILIYALVAILAVLLALGRIGNSGSARFADGKVAFPPSRASIGSELVLIGFLLQGAVRHLLRSHGAASDWVVQGALLVCSLAMLTTLPGTIVVTDNGLEQLYWFRRRVKLSWDAIIEVKLNPRTVTIQGEDSIRIVHTGQQVDRARLLVELKHHCGDDLPPEFPGEPQSPR
jgi:hypothetical protein